MNLNLTEMKPINKTMRDLNKLHLEGKIKSIEVKNFAEAIYLNDIPYSFQQKGYYQVTLIIKK